MVIDWERDNPKVSSVTLCHVTGDMDELGIKV